MCSQPLCKVVFSAHKETVPLLLGTVLNSNPHLWIFLVMKIFCISQKLCSDLQTIKEENQRGKTIQTMEMKTSPMDKYFQVKVFAGKTHENCCKSFGIAKLFFFFPNITRYGNIMLSKKLWPYIWPHANQLGRPGLLR